MLLTSLPGGSANSGLVLSKAGEASELWSADFGSPVVQPLPTKQSVLQSLSTVYFENAYLGNGIDVFGTQDLVANGTTQLMKASSGLFDGSDLRSVPCVEFGENFTDRLVASGSSFGDLSSSFAGLMLYRAKRVNDGASRNLVGKKRNAPPEGWEVFRLGNGDLSIRAQGSVGGLVQANLAGNHDDQAWHWMFFFYDLSTAKFGMHSDVSPSGSSGVIPAGTMTNVANMSVSDNRLGSTFMQVAYLAFTSGANAEGIDGQDVIEGISRLGATPSSQVDWFSRTSSITFDCGRNVAGECVATASGSPSIPQLGIDDRDGVFGLACQDIDRNYLDNSEDFSAWSVRNDATLTPADVDSPETMTDAARITFDGPTQDSGLEISVAGLTLNNDYRFSVWIRSAEFGARECTLLVEHDLSTISEVTFAPSTLWRRESLSFTMPGAGSTSVLVRVHPGSVGSMVAGDLLYLWGGQVNDGVKLARYIPTVGAISTTDAQKVAWTGDPGSGTHSLAPGQYAKALRGELGCEVQLLGDASFGSALSVEGPGGFTNRNRRALSAEPGGIARFRLYDDSSVLHQTLDDQVDGDYEDGGLIRGQWRNDRGRFDGKRVRLLTAQGSSDGGTTAFSADDLQVGHAIYVGSSSSESSFDGTVFKAFSLEREGA